MFAMATLDVNSVRICAVRQTTNSKTSGGRVFKLVKELPRM